MISRQAKYGPYDISVPIILMTPCSTGIDVLKGLKTISYIRIQAAVASCIVYMILCILNVDSIFKESVVLALMHITRECLHHLLSVEN